MAWEKKNKNWPESIINMNGQSINVNNLLKINPEIIYSNRIHYAREMIIKQEKYIWGKNGEFAIITDYDIMNALPRPDQENPTLNAYGMRMLRDYMITNNIDIPQE